MAFSNDCLDTIGVCANRLFSFSVGQCSTQDLVIQLISPIDGGTIDLTQYGMGTNDSSSSMSSSSSLLNHWCCTPGTDADGNPKHGVEIIIKDSPNSITHRAEMGSVISPADAELGVVHFTVGPSLTDFAGVFLGMALVWEHGTMRRQYPFYFEVTPSLDKYNPSGPLAIYEIRLAIRDMCPEANFLIDTVEFKDEEIYWAMRRPIEYWNEIPPPVTVFTPMTFPFRYHWLNATVGELLKMIAVWMRRNDLDYSAAGLTVQDTKKWPDYMKIGQELTKEYKEFVQAKKVEINIEGAYTELGGYRWTPYR